MFSLAEIQSLIENEIQNLELADDPPELYEPVRYVLQIGGKRIRPMLTLMACNLFSPGIDNAIKPAIGIEMFHNFTLLHDDIMDNAPLRRNKPTVHSKWNTNIAILSGDAMMIKSFGYFYDCDPLILREILVTFNKNAIQVCEGQQFDMNYENLGIISVDEYLKMIGLKTAALIGGSMKIGAILGGASETDVQAMYEFGKHLGLAFQLQDDYLDVYGDMKIFGKKIGGDIVSNKKTFLLISALNLAKDHLHEKLVSLLIQKDPDPAKKIREMTDIYNSMNINSLTLNKINEYFDLAFSFYKKVNIDENKKQILGNFVSGLINRKN